MTASAAAAPRTCKVCGRPLPDRTGQRGRPSDYCPPADGAEYSPCSRLENRLQEVTKLIHKIVEDCGSDSDAARQHLQFVKSTLWREVNGATNRGRLVGTSDKRYGKKRSGWWRNAPDIGPVVRAVKPKARVIQLPSHGLRLKPRVICPVCQRSISTRQNGALNKHLIAAGVCPGSGRTVDASCDTRGEECAP